MPRAYRDGGIDLNRTVKCDRKPFITIKHPAWVDIAQVIYPEALSDLSKALLPHPVNTRRHY